jgi:S1-C subfamily serine protease
VFALLAAAALSGCTGSVSGTDATGSVAATGSSPSSSAPVSSASPSAPPASGTGAAVALEAAYRHVIDTVLPSVVEIRTGKALGSGVVFDDKGHVVTNAHVVGSATSFTVFLPGRAKPVSAKLTGVYAADDLAVIQLADPAAARPAIFGRSSDLHVGDIVLAMGNPLGLASSVTNGIVSALGRIVPEPQGGDSPGGILADAIQTSAAINPGNSGGALVDLDGQVVGIPTLAAVNPEGGGAAPGLGFAISSDTVRRIAPQLISSGKVTSSGRASLGVRVTQVADQQEQPAGAGVVEVIAGGPAQRAGIKAGDVIVGVAGQPTPTTEALSVVLAGQKVGATVPVRVLRDGAMQTLQVTLAELKAP